MVSKTRKSCFHDDKRNDNMARVRIRTWTARIRLEQNH